MHGLALDFVDSVTVVLANGSAVEASKDSHPDLFWGIRGAGSNFGIVASWKLETFEAPTTLTRFIITLGWTKNTTLAGLAAVENYARNIQPREVNFRIGDYGKGAPQIEGLYYGTVDEWREAFQPLLDELPSGFNLTDIRPMGWMEAVISYSNYDHVDWTDPSPVR
jgi:FAD/FMN-containing dehydrogenase